MFLVCFSDFIIINHVIIQKAKALYFFFVCFLKSNKESYIFYLYKELFNKQRNFPRYEIIFCFLLKKYY